MSQSSGEVVLVGHMPGVRMDDEADSFLSGRTELQRLPWDQYFALTNGAHDRESEYIKGDPVVLVAAAQTNLVTSTNKGGTAILEMKAPSDDYEMLSYLPNLDAVTWALDLMYAAWACLSLAKPLSGLIKPRHSAMFLNPQGGGEFAWQDKTTGGIQLQGDADHEFFFADKLSAPRLSRRDIEYADSLKTMLAAIQNTPALAGALQSLLAAQDAALGRMEHALLCIIALEELLLEGQTQKLRRGFSDRLAALVPAGIRDQVPDASFKKLYDLRSDFLHGRAGDLPDADDSLLALAPMLLSAAIRSLAGAIRDGGDFADILAQGPEGLAKIAVHDMWQPLEEFRPNNRMSGHRHSIVSAMTSTTFAPKDTSIVWAPLLGLEAPPEGTPMGGEDRNVLIPLRYEQLEDLEDRLVRLDFMQRLSSAIQLGQIEDKGRACLLVPIPGGTLTDLQGRPPIDYPTVRAFVIAMRALGFGTFIDPVLLGEFRYHEKMRLRIPTIYRQTLLVKHLSDYDQPTIDQLSHASVLRDVVLRVSRDYPGIDRLLTLMREAHFHPVVEAAVRSRLCFAFIDGVIGRLGGDDIADQVAALGQRVAQGDVGQWFSDQARGMRNTLAHTGESQIEEGDLANLLTFTNRLTLMLLHYLHETPESGDVSTKQFRDALLSGRFE